MKKVLSTALALALVANLSAPTFAAYDDAEIVFEENAPAVIGILTDDNGVEYEIVGTLVENECAMFGAFPEDELSSTYRFDVPSRLIQNGSSSVDSPDSGYESHVYLTIHYKTNVVGNNSTYLLTSVSGYWTIENSNVSVTSTTLVYGCSAGTTSQSNWPGISVKNNFDVSTGFTKYIDSVGGTMGANLTLNYLMGSSRRWSFTLTNNLFNNGTDIL